MDFGLLKFLMKFSRNSFVSFFFLQVHIFFFFFLEIQDCIINITNVGPDEVGWKFLLKIYKCVINVGHFLGGNLECDVM